MSKKDWILERNFRWVFEIEQERLNLGVNLWVGLRDRVKKIESCRDIVVGFRERIKKIESWRHTMDGICIF